MNSLSREQIDEEVYSKANIPAYSSKQITDDTFRIKYDEEDPEMIADMDDFTVDIYVITDTEKYRDPDYTKNFHYFYKVTRNTSISELKTKLNEFLKTKGKQIVPGSFKAGRDGVVFSENLSDTLNHFKANIMYPDRMEGRKGYFDVWVKLEPVSQLAGKRKRTRKTTKKRKLYRKRTTNKNRKSYRRK